MEPLELLCGYQSCREEGLKPFSGIAGSIRGCTCTDAVYRRSTRMGMVADTFPKYHLFLSRLIIPPKGYISKPITIGQHIRNRRIELGITQASLAEQSGVTASTVYNWEHGIEPELIHMPKIVSFLGYVPFEMPDDPIGRLNYLKKIRGLSYERLGKLMKRDPEQLTDWLSGRRKPCKRNLDNITAFLSRSLS